MGEFNEATKPEIFAENRTGLKLFFIQFTALLKKNFLLSFRSKRATLLQLSSSLFFLFLIFAVDESIKAQRSTTTGFKNVFDPKPKAVTSIPACETGYYIKNPCYDFVWSGNSSARAQTIISNIMKNNPGRPIPASKVQSFGTKEDVDAWLLSNPMHCPGALHFQERNASVIAYGVQTNSTSKSKRGVFEEPTFTFQIPLQLAAEREITRILVGDSNIEWSMSFKEFAHPSLEVFSTVGTTGPIFLLAAVMFGFVQQISNIVAEREMKLRQAMYIMGLLDSAYWLTWLIWETLLSLVSSLLLVLFGMMFQFYFFLNNNFGVLFFMFFLFQFNMIGFAFMLSTFFSKSSSATIVGFAVFIVGFITQLVNTFGFPYDKSYSVYIRGVWSLFPPNLLSIGLKYLGDATSTKQDQGISWAGRKRCSFADTDCVLTMEDIYVWLISTFFVWFVLAIYFDNIFSDVNGVRKSAFYFLKLSYWTGKSSNHVEGGGICSCTRSLPPPPENTQTDEDVAAEEELVKKQLKGDLDHQNIAVQIYGLTKTFPGVTEFSGCCKYQRTSPYHAVKGLWVNLEKDKLFCLLGPNGAGKTTIINCLTGIVPTTAGDALVYGDSIRSAGGMSKIRRYMGVCPQFDILWGALTGAEHLHLFASIKGLPPSLIKLNAKDLLSQVKLTEAANVTAGSYSGGMKRRLSVAIALIGDPKLVYLDEPTTGMDPVTRRHVWDIIEEAKKGRVIVLTTHSMEEADILGDRIAIMARGKLRCLGTSIRLKSRFGAGYVVSVSMRKPNSANNLQQSADHDLQRDRVKQFFKEHLDVDTKEENNAFIKFIIPREREDRLTKFFAELEERQAEFGISDIQVGLTTLEEVFLNIARQAELETAAAEGRYATVTLTDGKTLQVPIGAQFVAVPHTETGDHPHGMMIELDWQQDDTGTLCLSRQSELMPAPSAAVESGSVPISRSRSRSTVRLGSNRHPIGWVVDP